MTADGPDGDAAERDDAFSRRVSAVLLADVSGFSALIGLDDEATARAVRRLQALVQDAVDEAHGRADAFAGDAVCAIFDSVVAAVDAALTIERRIAKLELRPGKPLQIRMGIHYGDVLLRAGAPVSSAVGEAINIAARLQALARPGTICISEGVYRQVYHRVDERFVDLGRKHLKNITEPVHAYLLIPRETDAWRQLPARRRRLGLGLSGVGLTVLLVAGALAAWQFWQGRGLVPSVPAPGSPVARREGVPTPAVAAASPAPAGGIVLGVMLFKVRGADGNSEWMCDALRDGLNTQLSTLTNVKVYSKEFLDFLVKRQGLSEIEVAHKLGITKILTGSLVTIGDALQLETHVVDVATGVLESSESIAGRPQDFLTMQNEMVLEVIARLDVPVTDAEKAVLLARQTNDLEALKLLMEAEGSSAPAVDRPPGATPSLSPRSALPHGFLA